MNKAMTTKLRRLAMLTKIAALLFAGLIAAGTATASEEGGLSRASVRMDDNASLQRGARLFF
jgi:ubiquinol-cytochrome c reductase cytochrome c1 subunit